MRRLVNLLVFAGGAIALVGLVLWAFRGQIVRFAGVSLDTGEAGETRLLLPTGLQSQVFASGLGTPRFMAVATDGTLLVAERGRDRIVALPDGESDGRADETRVVGTGYDRAHSLAFASDGSLLVAGTTTVFRVELGPDLRETSRAVFADGLPGPGGHDTRTVLVDEDGSVFVAVGSSCNNCRESDEQRAAVLRYAPEGGAGRIWMTGLRNAVGLALDPDSGRLIATVNGRDMIGDDRPPETIYEVVEGADAGWPRCHAGTLVDPELGHLAGPAGTGCQGVARPLATFQAHMAPLGLAFWRDRLVIAFHGSWNRSSKVGYKLMWLPWSEGGPSRPAEDLVTGFLDPASGDSTGRPAGVIVGSDGALYVSDDKAGFIYRITGPPD